jgi:cytochrome c551/c552
MKQRCMILLCGAILSCLSWSQSSTATLDQMIAAGKSQRELAQHLFDTQGCRKCHTIGQQGTLGFTKEGQERAQGFEGCISTLKAMTIIAKVPEDQRSATQLRRVHRFEEFGCATCHKVSPGKDGTHRDRSQAGKLAFRLRGRGEADSKWTRSAALIVDGRSVVARTFDS